MGEGRERKERKREREKKERKEEKERKGWQEGLSARVNPELGESCLLIAACSKSPESIQSRSLE